MTSTTGRHVFISYSRKDSGAMRRVVQHLRGRGIKAWVDHESLIPGTPVWEAEIEKAIVGCFAVLVILSPDAKNSEWVLREITLADEYQKRVFPVIVAGKNVDSIPFRLVTRQFADIRQNESQGLRSLSDAIASYWDLLISIEEDHVAAEQNDEDRATAPADRGTEEVQVSEAAVLKPTGPSGMPAIASLNPMVWIMLGSVIGGAVGGAWYYAFDPFGDEVRQAMGGAVAWALGGFALAKTLASAAEKSKIFEITLTWAIAGAVGWALGEFFTEASGAAVGAAVTAILAFVATSRIIPNLITWQSIAWITLFVAVGGAAGWSIGKAIQEAEGFVSQLYIGKVAGWAIGRAVGGAIGALGIVWQMRGVFGTK